MKRVILSTKIRFFLLAACLVAPGAPAQAADDPFAGLRNVKLGYAIYLGGIHLMDSATTFTREGPSYKITMRAGTQGIVRALVPWDAELVSVGRMAGGAVWPGHGSIVTRWKDSPKTVEFEYANGKAVKAVFIPPEGSGKHEPVPKEMRENALDPLNGIVQLMSRFATGRGCMQEVPIFDGHRRFDVTLSDKGGQFLKGGNYSVFTGMAKKCEVDFTMRAGSRKDREGSRFWEDKKNKGTRPPVYIYLGKVKDTLPPLPVRAETDTFFGAVMVHLVSVAGAPVRAAGR